MPTQNSKLKTQNSSKIWTPVELIRWTAGYLEEKGLGEPRLTAELLLADVLGLRRLDLYLQFDRPLVPEELAGFKAALKRRVQGEPLQYIAGSVHFRELRLQVDRRVLIPRPETELLVGEVLAWSKGRTALDVVDIGTGSGAIALSLRHEGEFGRIVATDVSGDALDVARANLRAAGVDGAGVEFREGAAYAPIKGERFDIIVSNPPYIAESDRASLPPEVVEWEPGAALFAGPDGLDVIRQLVAGAPDQLNPGGMLALEIGADQAEAVAELVRGTATFLEPRVRTDLAGRERMVLAELR
ncbi:MAG: peptide chain release factor N(5)-glutamine methyltransferase [Gemmatimonadota bacterium]